MRGPGRVWIFDLDNSPPLYHDTPDGVYDVAWSEANPNILLIGTTNGTIKMLNTSNRNVHTVLNQREHSKEINCIDCSIIRKDRFLSSSSDGMIKVVLY